MSENTTTGVARYELAVAKPADSVAGDQILTGISSALPDLLLMANARWFCRLRWLVIAFLATFGLLGMITPVLEATRLQRPGSWPFVAAMALVVANLLFLADLRVQSRLPGHVHAMVNLWAQIIGDLVVLTVVVHYVGSIGTFAAFAYLFHIVLACIFLSQFQSLLVTLLAVTLFVLCVTAEQMGILASPSLFADGSLSNAHQSNVLISVFDLASAIVVWLGVWYLASRLSELVRQRDAHLDEMNHRLVQSIKERSSHMLTTTHQLKSPFAAIQANAQLLVDGYCGPLPEKAHDVTKRIIRRCRSLADEIQQMLQLANLHSVSQSPLPQVSMALDDVLRWGIDRVDAQARGRRITFEKDLQPAHTVTVEDHLKMLVANLLSNAVNYSHPGGAVRVSCGYDGAETPMIRISDDGIGIPPEKLPRIFEDHYRTAEAAQHNKHSSGLGLSIVRRVAELHSTQVLVTSEPGKGTTFELKFASGQDTAEA